MCSTTVKSFCVQILDNDISKVENRGRGSCTIPLYLLEADQENEAEEGMFSMAYTFMQPTVVITYIA